jgi:hypothetical protein
MELHLQENMKGLLTIFLLILLPLILIVVGILAGFVFALFYVLTIFWFGMGVAFYNAIS